MANMSKGDYISSVKKEYTPICRENVILNGHMNDIVDELTISDNDLEILLSEFETKLVLKDYKTKNEYCDALVEVAKEMLNGKRSVENDAIIVDFVNYLAGKQCIDLALYTSDLN